MCKRTSEQRSHKAGVTLLELLLALALSVVVMTAIGMAINLHFKMLDARRTSIEEMQAVRQIAMRMASDIRTIVNPVTPDLSGLETTFANAMQAAAAQVSAEADANSAVFTGQGSGGGNQQGSSGGTQQGGGQSSGGSQGGGGQAGGGQSGGAQGGGAQGGGAQSAGAGQGGQSSGGRGSGQGGAQSGGGGQQGAGGQSGGSAASSSSSTSETGTAAAESSSAAPGVKLVGSATELRFDISRLPRIDQYQGIVSKGELSATDLPSDIKTVVYFIRSETSAQTYAQDPTAVGGEPSLDGYGRGLMRAELDRAVTSYSETGGATDAVYTSAQLLAEEVTGLEFQYYDGTEWLTEWDSSSQGLPRSIKVWLSVRATYGMTEEQIANAAAGQVPEEISFYFYVNIPTTPLVVPAAEPTATTESSTTTSSSASSTTTAQGAMP